MKTIILHVIVFLVIIFGFPAIGHTSEWDFSFSSGAINSSGVFSQAPIYSGLYDDLTIADNTNVSLFAAEFLTSPKVSGYSIYNEIAFIFDYEVLNSNIYYFNGQFYQAKPGQTSQNVIGNVVDFVLTPVQPVSPN